MQKALKSWSIIAALGLALVLIINAMAVLLPINNMSTGAISDLYPNLFVPAGFTFGIWSIIYLLLMVFCGYSIWYAFSNPENDARSTALLQQLKLFIVTCVINCTWIFLWHFLQVQLSLLVMISFLITLIAIYRHLIIHRSTMTAVDYYFLQIPFSVYLGWISVATIANTTAVLVNAGWQGGGISEGNWASILMIVAIALGLYFLFRWKDRAYAIVVFWAMYGIYFKQSENATVATTAQIGMAVLLLSLIYTFWKGSKKSPGL